MKKLLAVIMLGTTLLSVGCSNTSAGTGGNSVTKADLDKLGAEFRDELDALGVRVAELEKNSKSGGVSKSEFDRMVSELREVLNEFNSRINKLEKK